MIRKIVFKLLCSFFLFFLVFGSSACEKNPTKLFVPQNLQIYETTISWESVYNATGYSLNLDGEIIKVSTNSFNLNALLEAKTYTIKVKANGDGNHYLDSDWSREAIYTVSVLSIPKDLYFDGGFLHWEIVSNATAYLVEIDGNEYNAYENFYSLKNLTEAKIYNLRVKALSNVANVRSSDWSDLIQYTNSTTLLTPRNLFAGSKELTWQAVANATGYLVEHNGTEYNVSMNRYTLSFLADGIHTFRVKAIGNGSTYFDSIYSDTTHYYVGVGLKYNSINNGEAYEVSGVDTEISGALRIASTHNGKPVIAVGFEAFLNSNGLNSVIIPTSIKELKFNSFMDCHNLAEVVFEDESELIKIDTQSFMYCRSLKSITIPASVTNINGNVFKNCMLESIYVEEGNTSYSAEGNCLTEVNSKKLLVGLVDSIIPSWVEIIGSDAFCFVDIVRISIPASVKVIEDDAFYGTELESIVFEVGSQLQTIGRMAFGFTKITSIKIPAGVTKIGTRQTISASNAFLGCSNLVDIEVEKGNITFKVDGNCLIEIATNTLVIGTKNAVIPEYTKTIGAESFYGCNLTNLVIPEGVTRIEFEAFRSSSIESITISATVTYIGSMAFYGSYLKAVIFEKESELQEIASWAFMHCSSLKEIELPEGLKTIGENAFWSCTKIKSIVIPYSVTFVAPSAFANWSEEQMIVIKNNLNVSLWHTEWNKQCNAMIV